MSQAAKAQTTKDGARTLTKPIAPRAVDSGVDDGLSARSRIREKLLEMRERERELIADLPPAKVKWDIQHYSLHFTTKRMLLPRGGRIDDVAVVGHTSGVMVVQIVDRKAFQMVWQFTSLMRERLAEEQNKWKMLPDDLTDCEVLLEFPMGGARTGETLRQAGSRELAEEAGRRVKPERLAYHGWYHLPMPRWGVEVQYTLLTRDRGEKVAPNPDMTECIEPEVITFADAKKMLRRNEVQDLKTSNALYQALDYVHEL